MFGTEKRQINIDVFVTRGGVFRAKIKAYKNMVPYEVTIGGKEWSRGKGRGYEARIKDKCRRLLNKLEGEYKSTWPE